MPKFIFSLFLIFSLLAPAAPAQAAEAPQPPYLTADPVVAAMLAQVTSTQVSTYDRQLAGELPVPVDGGQVTLTSRYTYSGTPIQNATSFAAQHLQGLGLDVESQVWGSNGTPSTYPNVIGQATGLLQPEKIYIIGAHLDDVTGTPGADDNASGAVAVLLAADILTQYQWGCTLRFALWTGEEQGLNGSEAYAARARQLNEDIRGYLNLDMIAFNTKNSAPGIDLLYNPNMPETQQMAQLFSDAVSAYGLALQPQLLSDLSGGSDHMSFWNQGYRSILAIEDQDDFNPFYHQSGDKPANNNLPYFTDFIKASLATFVHDADCYLPGGVGTLSGTIRDSGGAPIPGALISVTDAQGDTYTALSAADGFYTRPLLAGAASVNVSAFGYLSPDEVNLTISAGAVTTADFSLQTAPVYTLNGVVSELPGGAPLGATLTVEGTPITTASDPASGAYSLALPAGSYTISAASACHQTLALAVTISGDSLQDFALPPLKPLLLVDDDQNLPNVQSAYTAALDSLGLDYEVWALASSGDPSAAVLGQYQSVIWYTGKPSSGTFSSANENAAAAYLQQGGNLLLTSHEYLYERGLTSFGQDYLGIATYQDDVSRTDPVGAAGDPVGDGLGPFTLSSSVWGGGTLWTDNVSGQQGSPFKWAGNGQNNSARFSGAGFKSVFLGWPLEAISAPDQRAAVLNAVVNWFGACALQPNTPPSVQDVTLNGTEDVALDFSTADFSAVFSDADPGNSLHSVRILTLPANGTLQWNGAPLTAGQEIAAADLGGLRWTPNADWNGSTSFGWNGSDGLLYALTPAQVLLNVAAVNDPPQVSSPIPDQQAQAGAPFNFDLPAGTFSDVDGDSLTFGATLADGSPLPGWLGFDGAAFSATPPFNAAGDWTIRVTASDGQGGSASTDFVLHVLPFIFTAHLPLVTR